MWELTRPRGVPRMSQNGSKNSSSPSVIISSKVLKPLKISSISSSFTFSSLLYSILLLSVSILILCPVSVHAQANNNDNANNRQETFATSGTSDKKLESIPKSSAYLFEFGPDFKPKYNGTFIPRHKLNLTEAAKKVYPKVPDYYNPGEGPEDDEDEDELPVEADKLIEKSESEKPFQPSVSSTSTTTTTPETPISSSESSTSGKETPQSIPASSAYLFEFGPDFKPKYNGSFVPRHKLNMTEHAKKVYPKVPDYYNAGEGPEDDDDDAEADKTISTPKVSAKPEAISTSTTTSTTEKPASDPEKMEKIPESSAYLFEFGPDFKPKYNGTFVPRHKLNLTEAAKKVYPKEPDYYDAGEGPEDDDEDEDVVGGDKLEGVISTRIDKVSTSSTTTTSTTTESSSSEPSKNDDKHNGIPQSSAYLFEFGPDFKPKYNGTFIPRHKLNLTEAAKKVYPSEPDYYEYGGGPDDDDDDKVSTTSTTTSTTQSPSADDDEEEDDMDKAVGGISGIAQKIIQGPKKNELNNKSTPEEIYSFLGGIFRDEASKAIKATIPKIYDYQYPIGELVSQRCFNSFAQFGDRVRKGYVWPMKMVSASSMGVSRAAFRDYGDFDACLNIIADDDERKRTEQFFTGQYCLTKMHLPLPKRKPTMNYKSQIFNFNDTELGGTFADFISSYGPFLYSNPVSFGVCVPSSCLPYEIEDVFNFFLKKWQLKAELNIDCYSKVNLTVTALPGELFDMKIGDLVEKEQAKTFWNTLQTTDSFQFWSIMFIVGSIVVVCGATFHEYYVSYRFGPKSRWSTERERPKSFITSFSVIHNTRYIFSAPRRHHLHIVDGNTSHRTYNQQINVQSFPRTTTNMNASSPEPFIVTNTSVFDGLKTLGLIWLCLANYFWLGYQPQMLPSVANVRDIIMSVQSSATFQLIAQFWLSMDIFFMISGFLFAFTAVPYISRRDGRPSLAYFIVRRVVRLLPSIVALICMLSLLPLYKNAGPMWNSGLKKILEPCDKFYWHNIFFVSNLYDTEHTCLPHVWHLSVEFQLTLLAVFVTIFAYNRLKHAGKAFTALAVLGVIFSGVRAYTANVRISTPIHQQTFLNDIPEMIRIVHFSTPVHFTAYFIGLALGFYSRLGLLKQTVFSAPRAIRNILWIVLPLLTLFALYLPMFWPFKPRFKSEKSATALYHAIYRILFVGTFVWIVNSSLHARSCVTLKRLCSISVFRLLSSLSLQIYLLNVVVVWIYLFTKRTIISDSMFDSLSVSLTLFLVTVALSLITYFLFEAPYRSLYRYYFESPRMLSLLSPTLQINGNTGKGYNNPAMDIDGNLRQGNGNFNGQNPNSGAGNRVVINGIAAQNGNSSLPNGGSKKIKARELNPNFLFSPHYNLVTNASSRAESETSSLSNFQMDPLNPVQNSVTNHSYSQNPNPDSGFGEKIVKGNSGQLSDSCESMASGDTRIASDDNNNNCKETMPSAPPTIVIEP